MVDSIFTEAVCVIQNSFSLVLAFDLNIWYHDIMFILLPFHQITYYVKPIIESLHIHKNIRLLFIETGDQELGLKEITYYCVRWKGQT